MSNNPLTYYQNKWQYSGSSAYYAHLYLPPSAKQALEVLYLLLQEWQAIPKQCSDPEIAHQKLSWWQNEIQACANNQAQHPLTQALDPQQIQPVQTSLLGLLQTVLLEIQGPTLHTDDEQLIFFEYKYGLWEKLCANLQLGVPDTKATLYAELAHFFGLLDALNQFTIHQPDEGLYFSEQTLKQHGLGHHDFANTAQSTEQFEPFFRAMLVKIAQYEQKIQPQLKHCPCWMHSSVIAFKLKQSLFKEVSKLSMQEWLNQQIDLPPVRKLWIAWRAKRL